MRRRGLNPPPAQRPSERTVCASVRPETRAALNRRAELDGVPLSHLVEDAIRAYIGLPPVVEPGTVAA